MQSVIRLAGVALFLVVGATAASATPLIANGAWHLFDVSDLAAVSGGTEWIDIVDGEPLSFTFTIAADQVGLVTIVDTVYAGDTFALFDGATPIGHTSLVPFGVYLGLPGVFEPDVALADAAFSRAVLHLGPGSYRINGRLDQSVMEPTGAPLNSTSGAISLAVSTVPEPHTLALVLSGLSLLGIRARRRV